MKGIIYKIPVSRKIFDGIHMVWSGEVEISEEQIIKNKNYLMSHDGSYTLNRVQRFEP